MARETTVTDLQPRNGHSDCRLCPVYNACLTGDLPSAEAAHWEQLGIPHVALPRAGMNLFRAGATADAIFVVRAGCIKTYTVDPAGQERVRGFHLPGDVVGLDALGAGHYPANAVALQASQVCRVAKGQLYGLLGHEPVLTQRIAEATARELRLALALSGDYTAEQRLAAFLLHLQERFKVERGEWKLPMGRRDIANYLRLATETVCRVLSRFEAAKFIVVEDKTLQVLAPTELWQLAEPVGICRPRLRLAA